MFSVIQVLVSVALLSTVVLGSPFTQEDNYSRIIDGREASRGQFPYLASVRTHPEFKHSFAAVIISNRFLLSSARRLGTTYRLRILVGGLSSSIEDGVVYHEEVSYRHKDFKMTHENKTTQVYNNIGLIKVNETIEFNKFVAPIALERKFIDGGARTVVSGWGWKLENNPAYNIKYIGATTLTNSECRKKFEDDSTVRVHDWETICVEYNEKNSLLRSSDDSDCHGDIGGPLVSGKKLIGIYSWYKSCKFGPRGFTRISTYIDWINEITKLSL